LAAAALSICACNHAESDVLRFWAMGREGEVVARMMPEFERRHPGARVRVQQIPWSAAHEKLLTAYVGGAMPDVFQAGNTWLPELAALGAVEPLDRYLGSSANVRADDYFRGIWDTNVIDGATLGVPWYVDTRVLFYRADILAAAGFAQPPRTWAEWIRAMHAIKTGAGTGHYAILVPLREWQLPVILALQMGAELLRDGGRYGNFRSPQFAQGFNFYLMLFREGLAPLGGETQVANVYQDFAAGLFSLYVSGPWNLGEFATRLPAELQDKWATAPLPATGGYPGESLAGGSSLALFSGSPHKDTAWKLIEFLSEPAQQLELYELTGDLPARRALWAAPPFADNARVDAFRLQLQSVRSTPKVPEWEQIAQKIAHYAEAAVRGSLTPEQALAALDADADRILEKRRWLLRSRVRVLP
jgi:multiple sugar transport system substrate-binding protein